TKGVRSPFTTTAREEPRRPMSRCAMTRPSTRARQARQLGGRGIVLVRSPCPCPNRRSGGEFMPLARRGVAACTLLLPILGCSHVDVAAERDAILATDKPWQEAIAAKDVDRTVSFWADDAVVLPPGQSSLAGKDAIRGFVTEAFKMPGFGLR